MRCASLLLLFGLVLSGCGGEDPEDPLASWNTGPSKKRIVDFVRAVTTRGGPDHVPPPERIAVFDNDGTLWCERPAYFQLLFAIDRAKTLARDKPELWKLDPSIQAAIEGDLEGLAKSGEKGLMELVMVTHAGMTVDEFAKTAANWIETARHPRFKRRYNQLVYQPMLELLDYLRANGFKTFIVSGGGIEFMRPWTERVYGIPPEQVVGSRIKKSFLERDGTFVIAREAAIDFVDDKAGKPIGIHNHIGRRPIAAFGNSDGDLQMLQWTTSGEGARLGVIVHHTDAEREYAYDRKGHVGRLDKALDEAPERGWVVVDMKKDWKVVFPGE